MRWRVSALAGFRSSPRKTRDTVEASTPASLATSLRMATFGRLAGLRRKRDLVLKCCKITGLGAHQSDDPLEPYADTVRLACRQASVGADGLYACRMIGQ